jgi:crossover junction endodeoxyribonuclease RusA
MKITLDYPPSLNQMYRVVNGRFLISAVGRGYKKIVEAVCIANRLKPLDGELKVEINAYRPRKSGDLDNLFKVMLDSLKGSAFHDDKQIVEIHAKRFDDKDNPRVEITVQELVKEAI